MNLNRIRHWFMEGHHPGTEPGAYVQEHAHKPQSWWKVMCLTGVDYFSTLGYQPGIAALAAASMGASAQAPIATLILVVVTLFGALPIYKFVAEESPHGEGSISMLEHLLSWWQGKLFVLALLGFAATDFVITITLSASDAAAHVVENPYMAFTHGMQIPITVGLIAALGLVFLMGFREAISIAVILVGVYLGLNMIVVGRAVVEVVQNPVEIQRWQTSLWETRGGNPALILMASVLLFPRLALGLSGFETGVVVMPLIKGKRGDSEKRPKGRIANAKKLLTSAAVIMSLFLIGSSFATTAHIPPHEFEKDGAAYGRALAYLAHQFFGDGFGTFYDLSTILILWFAGASAMAALLNLVPKYLPRYGMAPEWSRANRPLVMLFTAVAIVVTIIFKADVEAQGGAYATGVLVLMTSATVAATISAFRRKLKRKAYYFLFIALVFVYTTGANMVERPDGLKIALFFIGAILIVGFFSRLWRTLELRVSRVDLDLVALNIIQEASERFAELRFVPNHPDQQDLDEYDRKAAEIRRDHQIPDDQPLIFLEIVVDDPSNFGGSIQVKGARVGDYSVLRASAPAIPNAIAAIMLQVQRLTNRRPHAYFNWGEQNPFLFLIKYFLDGEGDVAPLTREILRRIEPDPNRRPAIHAAS
jgi:hypothetical protein